jgi:hypothetical protein
MGLDMYLRRVTTVAQPTELNLPPVITMDDDYNYNVYASQMVMYWRKANAIHGWFVDNVQNGEDDCKCYELSIDELISLRDACSEALDNRDDDALPTRQGFFFGSTEKDDYYWDDIQATHDKLNDLITQHTHDMHYTYQASW